MRRFIECQPSGTLVGIAYMRNGTVDIAQKLTMNHNHAAKAWRIPLSLTGASARI
jgi:hypothetical protein